MIDARKKAATTAPMNRVASQPKPARRREAEKFPMILLLVTTTIRPAIRGTATMPLNTALHTSIRIGLIGRSAPNAPIQGAAAVVTEKPWARHGARPKLFFHPRASATA